MKPLKKHSRAKGGKRRGDGEEPRASDTHKHQPPSSSCSSSSSTSSSHSDSSPEEPIRTQATAEGEGPPHLDAARPVVDDTAAMTTVAGGESPTKPADERGERRAGGGAVPPAGDAPGGGSSSSSSSASSTPSASSPNPASSRKTATFKARVPKKKYTSEHCASSAGNHGNHASSTPPLAPPPPMPGGGGAGGGGGGVIILRAAGAGSERDGFPSDPDSRTVCNMADRQSGSPGPPTLTSERDPQGPAGGGGGGATVSPGPLPRCSSTDTASEHSADLEALAPPPPHEPRLRPHHHPPPAARPRSPSGLPDALADALARGLKNQRVLARQLRGHGPPGEGPPAPGPVFRAGVVRQVSGETRSLEVQLHGEKALCGYPYHQQGPPDRGPVDVVLDAPPPGAGPVAAGTAVCVPFGGKEEGPGEAGAGPWYREGVVTQVDDHPAVAHPYRVLLAEDRGAPGAALGPQAVWVPRHSLRLLVPPWDLDLPPRGGPAGGRGRRRSRRRWRWRRSWRGRGRGRGRGSAACTTTTTSSTTTPSTPTPTSSSTTCR
ncbi:unnamed protein product [Gadus morhua 'NCC']